MTFTLDGFDELHDSLEELGAEAPQIAVSVVSAGVNVLKRQAINAVKGQIKKEIGAYIKRLPDGSVIGRVGLMVFPDDGKTVRGLKPHGYFLEVGTKYIVARHTIALALEVAMPRAIVVMERVAHRKINQVKGEKL